MYVPSRRLVSCLPALNGKTLLRVTTATFVIMLQHSEARKTSQSWYSWHSWPRGLPVSLQADTTSVQLCSAVQ